MSKRTFQKSIEIAQKTAQRERWEQWESEICDALELKADLTTSDAQGLMEANSFYIAQSWAKGLTATQTADVILNAGI